MATRSSSRACAQGPRNRHCWRFRGRSPSGSPRGGRRRGFRLRGAARARDSASQTEIAKGQRSRKRQPPMGGGADTASLASTMRRRERASLGLGMRRASTRAACRDAADGSAPARRLRRCVPDTSPRRGRRSDSTALRSWLMMRKPTSVLSRSSRMRSRIWVWIDMSRLDKGSSAMTSRGLRIMARAIATLCCWPPDS